MPHKGLRSFDFNQTKISKNKFDNNFCLKKTLKAYLKIKRRKVKRLKIFVKETVCEKFNPSVSKETSR